MSVDNTIREAYTHIRQLSRFGPERPGPDRPADYHSATRQANGLAALTQRQLRRASGVPGAWSRFLLAHARWILVVTLAAAGGALLLAHSQTPLYTSEAEVFVGFPAAESAGTLQAPDMATEKGVVSSGVVLSKAGHALGVPPAYLSSGLSVAVPATTFLMQIFYSNPNPYVAQARAQAVTRAYVSYRTPRPAPATHRGKTPGTSLVSTPTAAQLSPATLPASPSSPHYLVDVVVALLVGLILGIATAALRDHLDDRVRGPADLEALVGAPVLALIPAFRRARYNPAAQLVTVASPGSVPAEAYRGLRTRLIRAATARRAKVVLITCPAWEDKSTVAANLAVAMAQTGRSTVLACADTRWGHADELFGLAGQNGPARALDPAADSVAPLSSTAVPGLQLLLPGSFPADPVVAFEQRSLRVVLGELRSHADLIIIEAPPVLASADTGPLTDVAEMIVMVVDARSSARAQVRAAIREIEPARSKLAGCVLDSVGRRRRLPQPRPLKPAANGQVRDARLRRPATADTQDHRSIRSHRENPDQTAQPGAVAVMDPGQTTEDNR